MRSAALPWALVAVLLVAVVALALFAFGQRGAPVSAPLATTPPPTTVAAPQAVPTVAPTPPPPAMTLTARPGTPTPQAAPAAPAVEGTLAALAPTLQAALPTLSAIGQSEQVQSTLRAVTEVLAGAQVQIDQSPAGVAPSEVRRVAVTGSDASGTFQSLDPIARLAAAQAALALLGQVFPSAELELTISGARGALLTGSKTPGGTPSVDLQP